MFMVYTGSLKIYRSAKIVSFVTDSKPKRNVICETPQWRKNNKLYWENKKKWGQNYELSFVAVQPVKFSSCESYIYSCQNGEMTDRVAVLPLCVCASVNDN